MAYIRAAEREEQIILAAIKVLSDVGVANATLRSVASAAEIPLGTLHYVFPSKDQMLRAIIARVIRDVLDTVRAGLELDRGLEHAIRHGVATFWNTLVANEIGLQIMQYELAFYSVRSQGSEGLARTQYEQYTALVTEFCAEAARAANETCAVEFDSLGRLALAILDGLILQYAAKPDADRARADLDAAIDMIVAFANPQRNGGRKA
jgi:AcrR family transcriptional regulator